ncbi:YcdB/YcdC domain-containing protein [Sporomusa termitida]|uniref:YcdB/YcdC repeated domain-containing protein n=1 Tax=Sporomusa termitida TaxID=2377 RepID=A0A517DVF5_9FIRM|nr:YcdB/YcdC domain-containing protein [Sporomusa termitida]QDR81313.1 hypothetical protein SPTER_26910 [Sporomusa termitida]
MKYLFLVCVTGFLLSGCTTIVEDPLNPYAHKIENDISSTQDERSKLNVTLNKQQQTALDYALDFIKVPENYALAQVYEGVQAGDDVFVFRFTKGENAQIGGEHFSFVVTANENLLLGVMWMDKQFEKGVELPSEEETAEIAREYITNVDPDLFSKLQVQWIAPHDETISVDGKEVTVTGMKYKCYIPAEKTYVWVVVGTGGEIITFERGLVWDSGLGRRGTESWIYDAWLAERSWMK